MAELHLHDHKVDSIFQLLGDHENDISYSLAWVLSRCDTFLKEFLESEIGHKTNTSNVTIRLQHQKEEGGITDVEIESPGNFYIIIEAKRGWVLPTQEQLRKYAKRNDFSKSEASYRLILALSECSRDYAEANLEVHAIGEVPIRAISWKDFAIIANKVRPNSSHAEKHIIDELLTYLEEMITMQNIDSNWVYVVTLSNRQEKGWGISWRDIIKKRKRYFHPIGGIGRWPKEPPNYIAFRYDGKLQSVHHVEGYEVFTDPHEVFPEIPSEKWEEYFLYKLGPGFTPNREVRTGNLYSSGRVWCMLDTLFTSNTISDAVVTSQKREQKTFK